MQNIKEKIQLSGLKATPQRLAVYESMLNFGHASADVIAESLKNKFPTLTVATIYNVLESFVNVGILNRRYSSNCKMYFDVNTHNHIHIYDRETNSYLDYEDPALIDMILDYLKNKNDRNLSFADLDIQLIK